MLVLLARAFSLLAAVGALAACDSAASLQPVPRQPAAAALRPSGAGDATTTRAGAQCQTAACVYVVDAGQNRQAARVLVYPVGATGNAAPVQRIDGAKGGLFDARGIAVDAARNIYVVNTGSVSRESVVVYAAGAEGDATPLQSISGSDTGLASPYSVAVDAGKNIYVSNKLGGASALGSITVYAAGATGDVTPSRTISGSGTSLDLPRSVALDASGNVYVLNIGHDEEGGEGSITVYAANANGNATPLQDITIKYPGWGMPRSLAVDAIGTMFVTANFLGTDYIMVLGAGSNGNVETGLMIEGASTGLNLDTGIAVDAQDHTYVTNLGDPSANSVTAYAGYYGDLSPTADIQGAATKLRNAYGIAVTSASTSFAASIAQPALPVRPAPLALQRAGDGAGTSYIFASEEGGNLDVYSERSLKRVGQAVGVAGWGVAVNPANGDVAWGTLTGSVIVAHVSAGTVTPYATLITSLGATGYLPYGIAFDGKGNLFADNAPSNYIDEYKAARISSGGGYPNKTLAPASLGEVDFLACDGDALFADGLQGASMIVAEVDTKSGTDTVLQTSGGFPGGILFDAQQNLIVNNQYGTIQTFAKPWTGSATSTYNYNYEYFGYSAISLDAKQHYLWASNRTPSGSLQALTYPLGTTGPTGGAGAVYMGLALDPQR